MLQQKLISLALLVGMLTNVRRINRNENARFIYFHNCNFGKPTIALPFRVVIQMKAR